MKNKFNFNELKKQVVNIDWKYEWSKLQEETPQTARAIKLLVFAIIGVIVLRGCNSCNTNTAPVTSEKQEQVDTVNTAENTNTKDVNDYNKVEKESTEKNKPKEPDYQYNVTVFNEQIKHLYTLDQLKDVEIDEIRKAYFKAQKHWYEDFLLKQKNGELVNLKKYLD